MSRRTATRSRIVTALIAALAAALAVSLVVSLVFCALPSAAAAAGGVEIRGLDASDYPTVRLTAIASKPVTVTPALAENGRAVEDLQAENLGEAKAVVLAVDRSRSMRGAPLTDAIAAARTFIRLKAPGDRLGMVAFGREESQLAPLAVSSGDLEAELAALGVDEEEGTALYSAVVAAARTLRSDSLAGRVIVLLTDGRNIEGNTALSDAISAARNADAAVYAVGIQGKQFDPVPLRELARSTGGRYIPASSSARLSSIYGAISSELSRSWRISYISSRRPGETISVQASLVGAGSASARLKLEARSGGGDGAILPSFLFSPAGTIFVAFVVAVLIIAALGAAASARRHSWVRSRLEPHLGQAQAKKAVGTRERLSAVAALFSITESILGGLNVWKRLTRMLERADVPLRTVELVWIMIGAALGIGIVASIAGASTLIVLGGMAAGASVPLVVVWMKMRKRLDAFEAQLPDLLATMAASLKAGHSFKQGLQSAMEEGQEPASGEFRRVLTQTSLGRPVDDALKEMSDRLGSANFEFVITAVTIQRQVGGSLAQLFDMVGDMVRQRQQFARKVRSLTSMGRMSAYVLVGLPFFLAATLTLVNAEYMSPLWHTGTGYVLIIAGLSGIAIGSLLLKKIVSFRG